MSWLPLLPTAGILVAIVYLPGLALVLAAYPRCRPILALAQAPAWTTTLIFAFSIVQPVLNITWNGWILVGLTLLVAAVTALIRWGYRRNRKGADPVSASQIISLWRQDGKYLLLTAVLWVIAVAPLMWFGNAANPVQGGDSSYHYNQVWLMKQHGDIFPLTSNATMGGLDPTPWYYPNVWHALITATPGDATSVLAATNAMLLVPPLIFLISVGALTAVCGRSFAYYPWGVGAAFLTPVALLRLELITTLWPFVFAFSALGGVLAAALAQLRKLTPDGHSVDGPGTGVTDSNPSAPTLSGTARALSRVALFGIPLIGLMGVHPSVLLPVASSVCGIAVVGCVLSAVQHLRGDRRREAVRAFSVAAALVVAACIFVAGPGPQQGYFSRIPRLTWDSLVVKLFWATSLYLPHGGLLPILFFATLCLAVIAVTVWAAKCGYWPLAVAFTVQWLIIMANYVPLPIVSRVTALYYSVPSRAGMAAAIFLVPLFGLALGRLWQHYAPRACRVFSERSRSFNWRSSTRIRRAGLRPAVVVLCAAAAWGTQMFGIEQNAYATFSPHPDDARYLADADELGLIRRMAEHIEPGQEVIGDPAAGAALLPAVVNVPVVWPYPNMPEDPDDSYLIKHFGRLDAKVCAIVRRHNLHYFYGDKPRWYNSQWTAAMRPGLYFFAPQRGLTLIDHGGSAALYRIDACWK